MQLKIQITCQCGYDQYVTLSSKEEPYHCRECKNTLFKLYPINGYVYILSNPAMPGLLKIGYTERAIQERVNELNNTGLPSLFEIEATFESSKPHHDEQKIHNYLSNYRYSKNREFFRIDLKDAINRIVKLLSKEPFQIKNPDVLFSESEKLKKKIKRLERELFVKYNLQKNK